MGLNFKFAVRGLDPNDFETTLGLGVIGGEIGSDIGGYVGGIAGSIAGSAVVGAITSPSEIIFPDETPYAEPQPYLPAPLIAAYHILIPMPDSLKLVQLNHFHEIFKGQKLEFLT